MTKSRIKKRNTGFFVQITKKLDKKDETKLLEALEEINKRKNKPGRPFTVKAKALQREYHSSINILRKLRQRVNILQDKKSVMFK